MPIQVQAEDDVVHAIILRRRRYEVVAIQEIWRLDDEWWRQRPVQRLYFRLLLEDGRTLTVYRDLLEGSWWLQRY